MNSNDIRKAFLDFFMTKGHEIVPSAPIVLKDDPTLMFTNAGMNQFKDIFLGHKNAFHKRVANTQKCLRVSGKHNDLEEVGHDTYHHTMFEMLGNWSFGDYFKKEAIDWAWELLTEVYQLPKDRLYVSYFGGDEKEGLDSDTETANLWKKHVPEDRILAFSKKDNFWEMGETGPCGPCSEIHIDLRPQTEREHVNGLSLVNQDHPQVIEIWNLVFMHYNRKKDGSLESLKQKHVDTGMGFERLVRAIEGKSSNYDSDVFSNSIKHLTTDCNIAYGSSETTDIAYRVIADHVRAVAFSIADGQIPGNSGAAYVIRRILRRAIRYGYQFLNKDEAFIYRLIPVLANQFKDVFPELKAQEVFISKVVHEEENSFLKTLGNGIKRFQQLLDNKEIHNHCLSGKQIFELFDTYGFPPDLTRLIAKENNIEVDEAGFETEMKARKEGSRKAAQLEHFDWVELIEDTHEEFVGYDYLQTPIRIAKYRQVKDNKGIHFELVFNHTPFYAESGGQVGDMGYIKSEIDKVEILDTYKENNVIIHRVNHLPQDLSNQFTAFVDVIRRKNIEKNHTATHLLHQALRGILGTHVEQKGSLVNDDHLRFDFSHFKRIEEEEIHQIEDFINDKIRENIPLNEMRGIPLRQAKELGAMALFGEKYGDVVRVIQFGDSIELCGGTHCKATGELGLVKIKSESSSAAGIRRIEAVSGQKALRYVRKMEEENKEVIRLTKATGNTISAVERLIEENEKLRKEIEHLNNLSASSIKSELQKTVENIHDIHFIGKIIPLKDADTIKNICFQLKNEIPNLVLILGNENEGKAALSIMVSENLVQEKQLDASQLIREAAKNIQGGGGGQKFYASAGGKNPEGLQKAIDFVREKLKNS